MSTPSRSTKRERLLVRVRDIEDKLDRLAPDLDDLKMRMSANRARNLVSGIRQDLE